MRVRVDGVLLAPEDARAMWRRFSEHMEAHRGDLAGFAASEGFASVHPGMEGGEPLLVVSRTAAQGPYRSVTKGEGGPPAARSGGGSHGGQRNGGGGKKKRGGSGKKG